ncbi:EpsI family protein [Myxococcota bacterium]|nr:EpsI family protein [Myxococcota bacterium]MBU1381833.1 EpsI family protein [Myxococcota bacterium]
MGNKINTKLLVLSTIFLITCAVIYTRKDTGQLKKPPISQYLEHIENYSTVRKIQLTENASDMLNLDDYLYADYEGPDGKVNLYIGYYYTANKAYASHSPLICYPSQGWIVEEQLFDHILNVGPYQISYDEIIASLTNDKELVLYWYQAHHQTNTQIVKNKIDMGYNKLMNNGEQHAFVRVSVPLKDIDYEQAKKRATDFITTFYPLFIDFVDVDESAVQ